MRQKFSTIKFLAHNAPDLIVLGSGVCAVEAALCAGKSKRNVLLISSHLDWLAAEPRGILIDNRASREKSFHDSCVFKIIIESLNELGNTKKNYIDELILRKNAKESLENCETVRLRQSIITEIEATTKRVRLISHFDEEFIAERIIIELAPGNGASQELVSRLLKRNDLSSKTAFTEALIDGEKLLDHLEAEPVYLKSKPKVVLLNYRHPEHSQASIRPASSFGTLGISAKKLECVERIIRGKLIQRHPMPFREIFVNGEINPVERICLISAPNSNESIGESLAKARFAATGERCFT